MTSKSEELDLTSTQGLLKGLLLLLSKVQTLSFMHPS